MHFLLPLWTILYYFYSFYRWSIWIKSTTANHATMKWHSTNIRNRWRLDRCKSLIVWSPWKPWNIWRLVSLLDACLARVVTVFFFSFFLDFGIDQTRRWYHFKNPERICCLQRSCHVRTVGGCFTEIPKFADWSEAVGRFLLLTSTLIETDRGLRRVFGQLPTNLLSILT